MIPALWWNAGPLPVIAVDRPTGCGANRTGDGLRLDFEEHEPAQ
jgi:hypothetical protein